MISGIVRELRDGEVVFAQGDAAADMYIVRSGAIRLTRRHEGALMEIGTLGPGEFFGEMALFSPGPRSATATAVGETEVEVLDKPTFMALIRDPIVWSILAKMSERIRAADETVEELRAARDGS